MAYSIKFTFFKNLFAAAAQWDSIANDEPFFYFDCVCCVFPRYKMEWGKMRQIARGKLKKKNFRKEII
jgi:hypothetical protein